MSFKAAVFCFSVMFSITTAAPTEWTHPQALASYPQDPEFIYQDSDYSNMDSIVPLKRTRRDIGGSISTNPSGGSDAVMRYQTGIGSEDHNVIGTAFAAGNTDKGPVVTGGALAYNFQDHGLSVSKTHVPGAIDMTNLNGKVNLFKNDDFKLDANAFKTDMRLPGGLDLTKTGGNFDLNTFSGHGAKFEVARIPELGTTYSALGKLNLWESVDKATKLDLTGTASRTYGGLFDGQKNFGTGLGLTHTFG